MNQNAPATTRSATTRLQRALRAANPDWAVAEDAIRERADINARIPELDEKTLLGHVCGSGRVDSVDWLLDHGADLEIADANGWTPLIQAVWCQHVEASIRLLARGADPNAKTAAGHTALMYVAWAPRSDLAEALLRRGADPNACVPHGRPVWMQALAWVPTHPELIKMFLDHGADPARLIATSGVAVLEEADVAANMDAALAGPAHAAARHRLLSRLTLEQRAAWMPCSHAAEATVEAAKTWIRRP